MPSTDRDGQQSKPDPKGQDSTLVPMLIAGLILVVIGYAAIMLFV